MLNMTFWLFRGKFIYATFFSFCVRSGVRNLKVAQEIAFWRKKWRKCGVNELMRNFTIDYICARNVAFNYRRLSIIDTLKGNYLKRVLPIKVVVIQSRHV